MDWTNHIRHNLRVAIQQFVCWVSDSSDDIIIVNVLLDNSSCVA